MDDILYASIAQLAAQIRKGELSPVELIGTTLDSSLVWYPCCHRR